MKKDITAQLKHKYAEALGSVLPIVAIVVALSLTVAPVPSNIMVAFLIGSCLLIVGMLLFSMGAELAMEPLGQRIGATLTKSRKLWLILSLGMLLGVIITVSEPDLQVLAGQVQSIPSPALIWSVAAGVGIFLVMALLRMLIGMPLRTVLLISYGVVFALACFVPKDFLAVAFDSGGVTTGPMTVPFIMAFGVGICSIRNDKHAADDSFGLVALCSVGPILSVLVLSLIYSPGGAQYAETLAPTADASTDLARLFVAELPSYLEEIAVSLLPIAVFFLLFRLFAMRIDRQSMLRILIGILYTYAGLVLFLTGANVGFMPAGAYLGQVLVTLPVRFVIIPIGMLIGFFIVKAEPAVYVLMRQVEEITDGKITGKALRGSLSVGVSVSVGLALTRVLTGISVLWFLVPGYAIALILSFFTPKIFTAIAFDSGGVASGPMTATFLLPFAVGACLAVGGNVVTDAFGVVAMVAMTPLITIQMLGLLFRMRGRRGAQAGQIGTSSDDHTVIEL